MGDKSETPILVPDVSRKRPSDPRQTSDELVVGVGHIQDPAGVNGQARWELEFGPSARAIGITAFEACYASHRADHPVGCHAAYQVVLAIGHINTASGIDGDRGGLIELGRRTRAVGRAQLTS